MKKILIADDDVAIGELISDALEDEGFLTVLVNNGKTAVEYAVSDSFDLILLDVMMPGIDGHEVCGQIRSKVHCPIIFVSAKNRTLDTLLGLGIGADDYITKPFAVEELVARVKAHLRREERKSIHQTSDIIRKGEIKINKSTLSVSKNGKEIQLSPREFQLLCFFAENSGKTLSKEEIFKNVWQSEYGDIGTVAVNVKNLRNKIDENGKYIKTVWGAGYKFVFPD